ncbi:MAG: signal peptide peptidase SppA, partial [Burkholderiales bacterium]|nr:signal peptide peptidase SppA [Opitutaceae bacterium]
AFCVTAVVLLFGGFALLASMGEQAVTQVEQGSYLVLNLDGTNLTDAPPLVDDGGLAWLFSGDAPRPLALRQATAGLREAALDDRIRGVFLTGAFAPEGYGTGFAALEELRGALAQFRAAGKPVKVYFDQAGTAEMYLASVADEIVLNPFGLVIMPGLASEPMFYGAAFEKWGVGVQVTRSGKYKGAVEPFIRQNLSVENREQLSVLLGDLWGVLSGDIAEARGMKLEALQSLVDAEGLIAPESAQAAGLVTAVGYRDEVLQHLREETGADEGEPFKQVAFVDYLKHVRAPDGDGTVAIVYAEGEIVDGEGYEGEIGGSAFARELRSLREDEDISAVVLRVNSPGGSASASEEMLREVRLLREKKPVVVSMGSYAASGGYWISAFGDRIFTEASTVTGSIGVFGVQFDVEKLAASVGLTFDRVQTSEKAGMLTAARPKSPAELAVFQRLVDHTYDQFLDRVAEGRTLEKSRVDELAQGRVWSGAQAVKLGLADELGGLDAAIAHAAKLAKLEGTPSLYEYPGTRPLADVLSDAFSGRTYPETHFGKDVRGPAGRLVRQVEEQVRVIDRFNDPRGVYVRLPLDLNLR